MEEGTRSLKDVTDRGAASGPQLPRGHSLGVASVKPDLPSTKQKA